jgi:hypothetical protein
MHEWYSRLVYLSLAYSTQANTRSTRTCYRLTCCPSSPRPLSFAHKNFGQRDDCFLLVASLHLQTCIGSQRKKWDRGGLWPLASGENKLNWKVKLPFNLMTLTIGRWLLFLPSNHHRAQLPIGLPKLYQGCSGLLGTGSQVDENDYNGSAGLRQKVA